MTKNNRSICRWRTTRAKRWLIQKSRDCEYFSLYLKVAFEIKNEDKGQNSVKRYTFAVPIGADMVLTALEVGL
jgi:hypothetical protein